MEGIIILKQYFLQAKDAIMMIPESIRFLGTLFISAIALLSSANFTFNKLFPTKKSKNTK